MSLMAWFGAGLRGLGLRANRLVCRSVGLSVCRSVGLWVFRCWTVGCRVSGSRADDFWRKTGNPTPAAASENLALTTALAGQVLTTPGGTRQRHCSASCQIGAWPRGSAHQVRLRPHGGQGAPPLRRRMRGRVPPCVYLPRRHGGETDGSTRVWAAGPTSIICTPHQTGLCDLFDKEGFCGTVAWAVVVRSTPDARGAPNVSHGDHHVISISGLVVEYIVAIDVTRARFPADAYCEIAQR